MEKEFYRARISGLIIKKRKRPDVPELSSVLFLISILVESDPFRFQREKNTTIRGFLNP
jgi:hypothetical protein